jgi:HTH-type transcriptional repressor of NAD biosynthesis genes
MKKIGLIIGKFMPYHVGHEALIRFGQQNCDHLYVLLCVNKDEPIAGKIRLRWLLDSFKNDLDIEVRITDIDLPIVPYSSKLISKMWGEQLIKMFPDVNIIFTSERYGDFMAEYMGVEHKIFDNDRIEFFVSGTKIRNHPFVYWNYIPDHVKPYFVKKVCICGTESTGKSVLTEKLAKRFHTNYVQEWGREICGKTNECTRENIIEIGKAHAEDINKKIVTSNKILFSDTDLNTTKMYSYFLFNDIPVFENWIEEANRFDLYVFLENDAPYIQDGTRLEKNKRDELRDYHYDYLISKGYNVKIVTGHDWGIRYEKAVRIIEETFG